MSAWATGPPSPFARVGQRERQRAATRERLFQAALAEFRARGVERASVSEIARAAGTSRPSFYAHFPTLDHVLFELAWRLALGIVRRLEGTTGLRATLERLADAMIEAEQEVGDAALFRETVSVFARRSPAPELDPSQIPILTDLLRRFEAAREAGELRGGMAPEQAARLCLSGVFGHLLGVDATPDERRADLRALFALYLAEPG
ncbi:MAG TPA: TetR/AcrR family transcriptional regulator [Myxococcota bacterium]